MARWLDAFKSRRARGGIAVLGYAVSLAVNLFTSNHPITASIAILLAIAWSIYLFWPEIRALKITYPKNDRVESPWWLYIFAISAVLMVAYALAHLYFAFESAPQLISADVFSEQYIHGKHVYVSGFVDGNNNIQGRTFEDCWLYGPAVFATTDGTDIGSSDFDGGKKAFIPVIPLRPGVISTSPGLINVRDCKFRRCHFVRISIVGDLDLIEKWKKNNPAMP
jgi:hypothetical protein